MAAASELAEAYAAAGLSWMKRIVCAVAITSLVPGAILHMQSVFAIVRQMALDGLLMKSIAGKKNNDGEPACHWSSAIVIAFGSAAIATASLICSPSLLVGIVSIAIIAVHLLTVGTGLDAIYRPLEAIQRRRRRRKPTSGVVGSKPTTRQVPLVSSTVVGGLRTTASSASSVQYGTTLSPSQSSVVGNCENSAILEFCSSSHLSAAAPASPPDVENELTWNIADPSDCDSASASQSSDTDIDAIVDEYHVTRLTVLQHCRQDDALIDVRCPDKKSHRLAIYLLIAYVTSVFVFTAFVARAPIRTWPTGAIFVAVISLILAAATAASAAIYMFFLPRNDDVLAVTSSNARPRGPHANATGVRCAALASLGFGALLLALVDQVSHFVTISWIISGESRD
jgi:hypothetical protein